MASTLKNRACSQKMKCGFYPKNAMLWLVHKRSSIPSFIFIQKHLHREPVVDLLHEGKSIRWCQIVPHCGPIILPSDIICYLITQSSNVYISLPEYKMMPYCLEIYSAEAELDHWGHFELLTRFIAVYFCLNICGRPYNFGPSTLYLEILDFVLATKFRKSWIWWYQILQDWRITLRAST